MENQNHESSPSRPNQQVSSLSHELPSTSSAEQTQKRNRQESQQHESHDVSPQSPKRSRNANLPPPSFPLEIIVEILSNLPVKSLLRFRCVSKSWKTLISDPFFIKKHLKSDPKFSKKQVLINTATTQTPTRYSIKSCFLNSIFNDPIVTAMEIDYPLKNGSRCDWVVGSCNGLICVAIRQDTVILLNPALRVSKKLTDLGFKKRRGCYTVYGFGFDASLDDYKVVRVFCYQSKGFGDAYESIVRVYSLRTNSWRRIQDFPFGVPCNESAKHVDGNLNWVVFHGQEGFSCTIVSLDLAQETYKEVPQPWYGDGASERTLGVLDGCLCVLCNYGRLYAVAWVMKEYGTRESWTKLITIPYLPYPGAEFYSAPLFVSETGLILFHFGMNLVLYDSKENAFRIPVIPYDAVSYIDQAEVYEESLVSLTVVNQYN
ncbi:hypothetical protein F3Y22_tig00004779pilonHSYRG00022 [Hibiscus syriacus]|uniref:F-box domain-containing protein n=1 Tax=Hibiscus syriacus TaxID=106335 RepID=A0A6A3CKZ4_HIBSY|nr:F-box/kelch-repeat protein At3g23880-like [Hibiscus syriacus]XP_039055339.1 F-box/kelch-repeat protein At3g23880-like [Hibiscus syriacus]KAE8728061.1 hypothetical protein F3Y22_tig00004779pilonHSYRG00022 [Hibiscus syriacus]